MIFGLPLLTKDLIEQAAWRRTYVLRVVYAVVLYGAALWVYADIAGGGANAGVTNLGRGRQMFDMLVGVQFGAIIVLLPAICCGAITSEKERDTLGLLLLTQLSPTTIVLEKLISRLVTMGTYQLLSLPLFAVVYGLGGVELFEIIAAIWFLAWWSAAVGAWSIYSSAWHRTTAGAFISAYLLVPLAIIFGTSCLNAVTPAMAEIWQPNVDMTWARFIMCMLGSMILMFVMALPLLGCTWFAVAAAQMQLLPRAFVPPRNLLLEFFKKLDAFFEELNQQTTQGVVLVRDQDYGPVFDPIAWRETRKKSLGTVRYLFRLLVVLEVPLVLAISWTIVDTQSQSFNGPTSFFLAVLWPIAAVAVAVHATNVLASERSRQTLDVLLVAPMSPEELVTQKLAGVRRLIGVLSVPFATLLIFQTIWTLYVVRGLYLFQSGSQEGIVFLHEVLGMAVAMIVYLRLIQWLSFHLSMRLKNQTQAVLISLAVLIGVCALPFLIVTLLEVILDGRPSVLEFLDWLTWFSPARVLFHRHFTERGAWAMDPWFIGFGTHVALAISLWWLLRRTALRSFSILMGRTEPSTGTP